MNPDVIMRATVMATIETSDLNDEDWATLGLLAVLNTDPTATPVYQKAKPLFTEYDGTRMHPVTREIVQQLALERS